jgi:hypothetical protein
LKEKTTMNYAGAIIQLIVGVLVVYIMYSFSTSIVYQDVVQLDYTSPIRTEIFKGWISATSFTNRTYNTFNPYSNTYRDLPRSINNIGGVQFTFSVWTRFNDPSPMNVSNKVIFLYGDTTKYNVETTIGSQKPETTHDIIIKCPLVMFSNDGSGLTLQFNTNENIDNTILIKKEKSKDDAKRHNVMAVLPGKWVLWTFVFAGNTAHDDKKENGVRVEMYVNEFLHHTQVVPGSIRTNKGFLNILPEPISGAYLADFTYYNWALSQSDVNDVVESGMTESMYNEYDADMNFTQPNYINEYNKLEIHNL